MINNYIPFIKMIDLEPNEKFNFDSMFQFGKYLDIFPDEEKEFIRELATESTLF